MDPKHTFCSRCELPRTPSDRMLNLTVESVSSHPLSAWELWLVNKAKQERLMLEKQSEEASQSPFSNHHYSCFAIFGAF